MANTFQTQTGLLVSFHTTVQLMQSTSTAINQHRRFKKQRNIHIKKFNKK